MTMLQMMTLTVIQTEVSTALVAFLSCACMILHARPTCLTIAAPTDLGSPCHSLADDRELISRAAPPWPLAEAALSAIFCLFRSSICLCDTTDDTRTAAS